jgi:phospholipase/lecithinase/hemolysin
MAAVCTRIRDRDRNSFFMFGNLPNPQGAVRFLGQEATEKVRGYQQGSFELGFELANTLARQFPHSGSIVDIYTPMEHVNNNLRAYGITEGAQPRGVPVRYGAPPSAVSSYAYTSDEAHPTEEVYKLIAKIWAEAIVRHYQVGMLNTAPEARFPVLGQS